jgi:colanic acid/amylovoran biosynthesis glycosyltransferase
MRWWTGIYGRFAVKVIYLNNGAARNLLAAGVPAQKLTRRLWGNWGIDCGEFSPQSKSKVKSQKLKVPIVLFVGRMSEAKGVPWLIEAMEQVIKKFPKAQLWLAGPMVKNSKFQIPNSKLVKQLGVVKNQDLPVYFRQATVVAAPSITTRIWEEQVGNVILQALACGVPVVATLSGAIPEYVQDGQGVILVPEKNSQAISQAIIKIFNLSPKDRKDFGLKGRSWVLHRYEVKKNIGQLEKWLLQQVAQNSKKTY